MVSISKIMVQLESPGFLLYVDKLRNILGDICETFVKGPLLGARILAKYQDRHVIYQLKSIHFVNSSAQ